MEYPNLRLLEVKYGNEMAIDVKNICLKYISNLFSYISVSDISVAIPSIPSNPEF